MTRLRALGAIVAVAVVVLGACGSDQPDVSASASAMLQDRVAEIRTLAEARQADAVIAEVDELRSLVEQMRDDGEISAEAANEILVAAIAVRDDVATITTTTTTTTTRPPEDENRDDDEDDDDDDDDEDENGSGNGDKGNGNEGKGKGNGGDD